MGQTGSTSHFQGTGHGENLGYGSGGLNYTQPKAVFTRIPQAVAKDTDSELLKVWI